MEQSCKILVVDDEPIVGDRLRATLEREGHSVTTCVDPAQALSELENGAFDIVISDVRMGEIDGLQVLEKALTTAPRTRVIMITGYATLELARESLAKGAFDFIAKPFKLGEIRKLVNKAIEAVRQDNAAATKGQ